MLEEPIKIRVYGNPQAQPRARARVVFSARHRRFVARVYDARTAAGWQWMIGLAAKQRAPRGPITGPVRVDATWLFARPQRLLRKGAPQGRVPHIAKPDRDNCDKILLDTLTTLGFWRDDAQVCAGELLKFYAALGEAPGLEISISQALASAERAA